MENDYTNKILESSQNQPTPSAPDKKSATEQGILASREKQQVKITGELHDARISYSGKIFLIALGWLAFTAIALTLAGFGVLAAFESSVLIALISSTTVATLGLFFAIGRLLSPKQSDNKEQSGASAMSPMADLE